MAPLKLPYGSRISVLSLAICGLTAASSLHDGPHDSTLLAIMDGIYRMDYARVEKTARTALAGSANAALYFSGLAAINAFSDVGDTSALRRAEDGWSRILATEPSGNNSDSTSPLYRGLSGLQLSYVASLRGQSLRTGRLAWSARSELRQAPTFAEAEAALSLFDYYRQKLLEKISFLPFVNPNPGRSLRNLRTAAENSRYLRDVLRASAFWIHFDRGEMDSALTITDGFLLRYPENRLARQMRGDALFRMGRLSEARSAYETLLREYASLQDSCRSCLPIGFACATGNLARIYAGLGLKPLADEYLRKWKSLEAGKVGPWLPGSLKRDLSKLSKK